MSGVLGRHSKVWLDQWNFSGHSNNLAVELSSDVEDVTTFQAAGREYVTLDPLARLRQQGYVQSANANGMEAAIQARLGANTAIVAALFGTTDVVCPAYVWQAAGAAELTVNAPVASVLTLAAAWLGRARRGLRVADQQVTGTGALDARDFGAAGSAGGVAFLFLHAVGGSLGTAQVQVQCATTAGFGSPTTKGTFNVTALGALALTLSGTIERFVRFNVTSMGGATSLTIGGVVCVNGVTM